LLVYTSSIRWRPLITDFSKEKLHQLQSSDTEPQRDNHGVHSCPMDGKEQAVERSGSVKELQYAGANHRWQEAGNNVIQSMDPHLTHVLALGF
jgi:hypothetical protein